MSKCEQMLKMKAQHGKLGMYIVRTVHEGETVLYISTSSTTSTLRLPLYILSVVSAYQKAHGTGKRVRMVLMYCEKFK